MEGINIGSLYLSLGLDPGSYHQNLQTARQEAMKVGAEIERNLTLKPKVDHTELYALNRHLDLKQKHFKEAQRQFDSTPLKPRVDLSEIRQATIEIQKFQRLSQSAFGGSRQATTQTVNVKVDTDTMTKDITQAIKKGFSGSGNPIASLITAPFKIAANLGGKIITGVFEGIGTPLGREIGKGLSDGIEAELGSIVGSFKLVGREIGKGLAEDLVNVLSDELRTAKPMLEEFLGKKNVVQESAAVKARQGNQARQMRVAASGQILAENDFFDQNRDEIKRRAQLLDKKIQSAGSLQEEINKRVRQVAEKMGVKGLETRQEQIRVERINLSEKLTKPNISTSETQAVMARARQLTESYNSIGDDIKTLNKDAEKIFAKEIDRLAVIKEQITKEDRELTRIAEAPSRLQYATTTPEIRSRLIKKQQANAPSAYKTIAQEVARRSGVNITDDQIPVLKVAKDLTGNTGRYMKEGNQIHVSQDVMSQLSTGRYTEELVEVLTHELRHGVQMAFGRIKDIREDPAVPLMSPNFQESRHLGRLIESSVGVGSGNDFEARRRLEADAYTFAARNRSSIFSDIRKQAAISNFQSAVGVGGGKAELNITKGAIGGLEKLKKIADISPVDVSEELNQAISKIEKIQSLVVGQFDKLANIDVMGADEIVEAQNKILASVKTGLDKIIQVKDEFKQTVLTKPDRMKAQSEELLPTFSRKQLNSLANEFGVDPKGMRKGQLAQALANQVDIGALHPKVLDISRDRAQQMATRQEQMQSAAQMAGQVTRTITNTANQAIRVVGQTAQPAMQKAMQAGRTGYAIAQGVEDVVLGAAPFGKTGKSVLRNVILPAAGFAALSHYAPGGGAIAEGMSGLVHQGTSALGHMAGAGMQNALHEAPWMVQQAAKPVTMLANWGVGAVQPLLDSVLAPLLGGRIAAGAAGAALKLPMKQLREPEPLMLEARRQESLKQFAPRQFKALEPAKEIEKLASSVDWGQVDKTDLDRVKAIGNYFSTTYKRLMSGLKQGANTVVEESQAFVSAATKAQQEIDAVIASLKASGVDTSFTSELGSKLQGLKGQIGRKRNEVDRKLKVMSTKELNRDDITTIDTTGSDQGLYSFEDIRKRFEQMKASLRGGAKVEVNDPRFTNPNFGKGEQNYDRAEAMIEERYARASNGVERGIAKIGLKEIAPGIDTIEPSAESLFSRLRRIFVSGLGDMGGSFSILTSGVKGVLGAIGGFTAAGFAISILKGITDGAREAALEMESLERSMSFTQGGSDKGIAKIQQLKKEANDLGISAKESIEGFTQLASAAKDTNLEGTGSEQFFKGLQAAATASNATPDRQKLINLAGSQMLQKGVLSQEEIRQQLAENLPGVNTTAILARSQNMSVPQLNKAIESGTLTSDILPKFGLQLQAELAIPAESASKSAQASFNRLENSLTELQATAGKGILPIQSSGAEAIAQVLNAINQNAGITLKIFTAIAIMIGVNMVKALYTVISRMIMLPPLGELIASSFRGIGSSIGAAAGSFAVFAGRIAAITLVLEGLSRVMSLFSDKSNGLKDGADAIEKSVNNVKPKEDSRKEQEDKYSKFSGLSRAYLQGTDSFNNFFRNFNAIEQFQRIEKSKQQKDETNAVSDTLKFAQQGLGQSRAVRQGASIGQMRSLDKQIEDIQLQQRVARQNNPDDVQGLNALNQQEQALRKQSESLLVEKGKIQKMNSVIVESLKTQIEKLDGNPQYNKRVEELKELLKEAEAEQKAFNDAADSTDTSKLERMARLWKQVADRIEDAVAAGKQTQNMANVQVSEAQLTGQITQGQASGQKSLIEQSRMMSEMTQKYAALNNLKARVNPDSAKVLGAYGLTNAGAAELSTQAEASQNPKEKQIFQQSAQLKQLESQVTQLQDDLTNSAAQMSQQLQDAAKTVQDFYRGIQRQSEDVALTVKSSNLEASLVNVKNRVKRSMDGFYDTFVDQFANGLIEVFSKWNESLKIGIDAQKQILQTTNQLTDQQLQATELYKGLPGAGGMTANVPGGFAGGDYKTIATGTLAAQEYGASRPGRKHAGQDLDLGDNDSFQSYIGGRVTQTGNDPGGYYHWIDIFNDRLKKVERIAELDNLAVKVGDTVNPGQVVGQGTKSTGVVHYEIRNDFDPQGRGGFGFGGTQDPVAFLESLGLVRRQGTNLTPTGKGISQRASISEGEGASSVSSLNTFGFDQAKVAQGIAFYLSQGFSKRAAGYLVGNFMQESSLNPSADNGSHRGLAQWDASRSQGMPSDYQGQLKFSIQDLMRDSPGSLATFKNPNASDSQIMRAISQWERYGSGEEASRFKYGKGLADQLGQSGRSVISPTTGMTNQELQNRETFATANAGFKNTIDSSLRIASQSAQQSADAVQRLAAANQGLAGTEAGQLLKRSIMQYRTSAEDQTYELTQKQRKQEDYNAELGFQTPEKLRANQERQVGRDYDDEMRDLTRKSQMIDEMIRKNNILLGTLKDLEKQGQFRGHEAELKGIYDSVGKTNSELQKSKKAADQLKKTIPETAQKRYNDIAMKDAVREEKDRLDARIEAQSRRQQIAQMQAAKYKRDSLEINPDFDVLKAAGIERDEQLRTIEADQAKDLSALKEKYDLNKLTNIEFEDQRRLIEQIADLSREEARAAYQSLEAQEKKRKAEEAIANRAQLFDSAKNIGQAMSDSYKLYGLDSQSADYEKEMALAQQRFDFDEKSRAIDDMAQKSDEFKKIAGELHQNLEKLNKIKLDNIRAQFDPLVQVIGGVKDSFQGFFASIFSGSKSLADSFRDLISSIGQNLANAASKLLTDQLFGMLLGKDKKTSEAGAKDLLGSISPLQTHGGFGDQAGQLLATSVNDSAAAFLGMSKQAGSEIIAAAQEFARIVNSSSAIGMDGVLPTSSFGMGDFTSTSEIIPSLDKYANFGKDVGSDLFNGVENATFSLQSGVQVASDLFAQSGVLSSNNLLGGLAKGLPSVLGAITGAGGGGGFGGILSTILGIGGSLLGGGLGGGVGSSGIPIGDVVSVFGFANGGSVGANGLGMPDIDKALKREALLSGRKPKLATLYEGEEVLTHHQARRYHELGLDKLVGNGIQSFARGGSVGSSPTFNASSFRNSSVSIDIPITVNQNGGDKDGVDVAALKRELELKVREVIIREQRPKGLLS